MLGLGKRAFKAILISILKILGICPPTSPVTQRQHSLPYFGQNQVGFGKGKLDLLKLHESVKDSRRLPTYPWSVSLRFLSLARPETHSNLSYFITERQSHHFHHYLLFIYSLPYGHFFGGVEALSREHFELINGFSNIFWGWGGEDDNLYFR